MADYAVAVEILSAAASQAEGALHRFEAAAGQAHPFGIGTIGLGDPAVCGDRGAA